MTETTEDLLKYTRRELEGMAEKLGIETLGIGTKTRLAETIIKAKEKAGAKKIPKPKVEAPVKMQTKPRIGKKGVLAKRAAIDAQMRENENAVANIGTGVKELLNGVKDMRSAMDNKAKEMLQEGIKELQEGIKEVQKGVREMHKGIGAQIKENEKAAAKMDLGVKELLDGIKEFETEIKAFQDETADYIKDFYYG